MHMNSDTFLCKICIFCVGVDGQQSTRDSRCHSAGHTYKANTTRAEDIPKRPSRTTIFSSFKMLA